MGPKLVSGSAGIHTSAIWLCSACSYQSSWSSLSGEHTGCLLTPKQLLAFPLPRLSGTSPATALGLHICCLFSSGLRACWWVSAFAPLQWLWLAWDNRVTLNCSTDTAFDQAGHWGPPDSLKMENGLLLSRSLSPPLLHRVNCESGPRKLYGWWVL